MAKVTTLIFCSFVFLFSSRFLLASSKSCLPLSRKTKTVDGDTPTAAGHANPRRKIPQNLEIVSSAPVIQQKNVDYSPEDQESVASGSMYYPTKTGDERSCQAGDSSFCKTSRPSVKQFKTKSIQRISHLFLSLTGVIRGRNNPDN